MLGLVVVLLGGLFVALGLHALVGEPGRHAPGGDERARRPVAGAGSGDRPATLATRRLVGAMWLMLGALFLVAAFTHQVP